MIANKTELNHDEILLTRNTFRSFRNQALLKKENYRKKTTYLLKNHRYFMSTEYSYAKVAK